MAQPLAVPSSPSERSPLLAHLSLLVGLKPEEGLSSQPKVAVMVNAWPVGAREQLAGKAEVVAEAALTFFGELRQLILLQLSRCRDRPSETEEAALLGRKMCAVEQLRELEALLDEVFLSERAEDGLWMWPLHDYKECSAVLNIAAWENERNEREVNSVALRMLRSLSLAVPYGGSGALQELRDRYGAGQAYSFAWSYAYVQMLWMLAAIAGTFFMAGGRHPASEHSPRVQWEVFKIVLMLWGVGVVAGTWRQKSLLAAEARESESAVRNPAFRERSTSEICGASLLLAFGAFPLLILCIGLVACLLLGAIQFQAWLIWDWGDCIHLGCRDAQMKHGFWGWLLEVSSDVVVAIIFEGMLALSQFMGEWVARLENHRLLHNHRVAVAMHVVAFEAIGKVVPYVFLAILFVPQWNQPIDDPDADCSDLMFYRLIGSSAFQCVRRRVPLARRRTVFKLFMKGPFVVAPFISILMKAIVPLVARCLDFAAERAKELKRCNCCTGAVGWIARLLGLIFSHDGDSVGCLRYVFEGKPYGQLQMCQKKEVEEEEAMLSDGLRQGCRKLFEPIDELLELKLSFLWVLFFAPVMPIGVLPTLGARLLETRSDLTKMLYVRRRGFPEEAAWLHTTQRSFAVAVLLFAGAWSALLSLVTYNDDFWVWRHRSL